MPVNQKGEKVAAFNGAVGIYRVYGQPALLHSDQATWMRSVGHRVEDVPSNQRWEAKLELIRRELNRPREDWSQLGTGESLHRGGEVLVVEVKMPGEK